MSESRSHQSGQAALPVALLALALLVSVGLVARWGQAALSSSRAQAAADAAALATLATADLIAIADGVLPDDAVAADVIGREGGELVGFDIRIVDGAVHVEVVAELGGQRASAAAAAPLRLTDTASEPTQG